MHDEYTILMSLVLDREATAEQVSALHDHVRECAACAATWREWQALDVRLAAAPPAPAPALAYGVAARLAAADEQRRQRRRMASGLFVMWGMTLAALWMMMIGLLVWAYSHPVEASLLLSAGAQAASSLAGLLGGAGALLGVFGRPSLMVGLGCLAALTAGLSLLWLWITARSVRRNVAWEPGDMAAGGVAVTPVAVTEP